MGYFCEVLSVGVDEVGEILRFFCVFVFLFFVFASLRVSSPFFVFFTFLSVCKGKGKQLQLWNFTATPSAQTPLKPSRYFRGTVPEKKTWQDHPFHPFNCVKLKDIYEKLTPHVGKDAGPKSVQSCDPEALLQTPKPRKIQKDTEK